MPVPQFHIGPIPVDPGNPLGPLSPIHPPDIIKSAEAAGKIATHLLDPQFWVRVGEVLVGTVLLIVGMDHIFDTNMTGKLAKVAPYMMV